MSVPVETIHATSDTSSLLNALSKAFTNSTTFIAELLQNARRAGATEIDLVIEEGVFQITDNGVGIADFSKLLSIATSGWDEATKAADGPYGLGFLSAVYSATSITVNSRGKHFSALCADILAVQDIPVIADPQGATGRTIIRLEGLKTDVRDMISQANHYLSGFPIPVTVNGEAAKRPYAEGVTELVDTRYGKATLGAALGEPCSRAYLQGSPITITATRHYGYERPNVIHLDPAQFEGRMPDRAQLCDMKASEARLSTLIREEAIDRLTQLAKGMTPEEFVGRHGDRLVELKAFDLLNSFDCFPAGWVLRSVGIPRLTHDNCDEAFRPCSGVLTRDQMKEGLYELQLESEDLAAEHVLAANGKFVAGRIPADHWLADMAVEVENDYFECRTGDEIATETVEIFGTICTVILTSSIEMVLDRKVAGVPESTLIPCYLDDPYGACKLYVTPDMAGEIETLLYQVTNFVDSDDRYDENAEWEAHKALEGTLIAMKDRDPVALLKTLMQNGLPFATPKMLRGGAFVVRFDDAGGLSIDPHQAQAA